MYTIKPRDRLASVSQVSASHTHTLVIDFSHKYLQIIKAYMLIHGGSFADVSLEHPGPKEE
jgi:hypothetical protein